MALTDDIRQLFPDARFRTGYASVRCPFHSGGQERHPSMSIITEPRNGMNAGQCKCFSCGWTGTFKEVAEHFGLQYLDETDVPDLTPEQIKPTFQVATKQAVYKKDVPYRFSPYLAARGIFEDVQQLFRVYDRPDEHKVYLPVFSKEGQFLFANARATDSKKFFIDSGIARALAGIEEVDFNQPIAICESQINAMTVRQARFCRAVATLGAQKIDPLYSLKEARGPFILMYDGDTWGRKATKKALDLLGDYRCKVVCFPENKDVNDIWQDCGFNADMFIDEMDKRTIDGFTARSAYCLD